MARTKKEVDAWTQGFAVAAAFACQLRGSFNPHEIFTEHGITLEDMKEAGVDAYDLKRIARALNQTEMRRIRRPKVDQARRAGKKAA